MTDFNSKKSRTSWVRGNIGGFFTSLLGHLTTPFQLKDTANQALGEIASSGIYLTEQGQAGSVQQLNFLA